MTYLCENCGDELDEDVSAVVVLKVPELDEMAWCADKVECAQKGAETIADDARKRAEEKRA